LTSLLGRQLGRYEIRAELGRGGMARVYRAIDTLLQRPVAIKVLAAQLSMDPEFVQRFEREARTAAGLRHPGIVTIYDVGEQDGLYYIAMEFISGRTLHSILEEQSTLGLGYAVSILDPLARALDFAHSQGAVHRDVKPHNMMVDTTGRVVLTDFGIAQTPDADGDRLTRTGVFMGTPEYISPEQAEARRVDGRSDLYSLGIVAYEIITGRVPFSGATPQLIVAHAQIPPPPPTSVLAYLPGELDVVLTRALAKRPERRYATGTEMVEALRGVAQRYGTPLASREQLAALVSLPGLDEAPPPVPSPRPAPAPRPSVPAPAPRPATQQRPAPRQPTADQPVPPTRQSARIEEARARRGSGGSPIALLLIGGLLVALTLLLLFAVARGLATGSSPTATPSGGAPTPALPPPSPTPAPPPSPTPAPPPSPTPAPPPSDTPARPTIAPPTPRPATAAPQPPTETLPAASDTPAPAASDTPAPAASDTPAPPTTTPAPPTTTPAPPTTTPSPSIAPSLTKTPELTPLLGGPTAVTPIYPPNP
jgi:serine/threonine-protein kinase